ncbi:unnamed protein product [Effrenium voratum]|nr:unnamed protein product [Effrenium voratum]
MAAKRSSALVRFVYARCGAKGGEACAALGARRPTNFSELRAAVQDSWPAILGSEGVLPSALLAPLPDLIQLADLCGHRQVAVRLPKARLSFLGVRSSFLEDPKERTFGDVRKGKAPYEDAELAVLKDVIQELTTSQAARRYAASVPLDRDLPELAALAEPLRSHWAKLLEVLGPEVPNTPVMYLGSGEQRTPLHCDPTENITIVVQAAGGGLLAQRRCACGLLSRGRLSTPSRAQAAGRAAASRAGPVSAGGLVARGGGLTGAQHGHRLRLCAP